MLLVSIIFVALGVITLLYSCLLVSSRADDLELKAQYQYQQQPLKDKND